MASTGNAEQVTENRCLRCGRKIRAGAYGPKCAAKVRAAATAADLSDWTAAQAEDARELIDDGGVVPTAMPGVFRTVSHDGERTYLTSARFCGCARGLKGRPCLHGCAVVIVLGTRPQAAPAPVLTSAAIWAALDSAGATAGALAPF